MKNWFSSFIAIIITTLLHQSYAGEKIMTGSPASPPFSSTQEAIFAMGCFWCGAAAFADHDTNKKFTGIVEVKVGFAGGTSTNPTYASHEGYQEVVKVVFDPKIISYTQLLDIFWHNIDPFDDAGQFCDKGDPYKSIIFFQNADQEREIQASKEAIEKRLGKKVVTDLKLATPFYDAEDEHQDYKIKNPVRYKIYRWNCGRDQRLKEIWK
jgi:peptide-methionine (S)-S-oxide reductase